MTDYRAIMTLLIKQRSYRQIEQQLGCSHRVIARANHTLRTCGFSTVEQVAALTDNELDELFVDKRSTGQGEFVPIDFEKVALPVLECIDFVSDVGGVDQAPQYVVVEVAESQGDAA